MWPGFMSYITPFDSDKEFVDAIKEVTPMKLSYPWKCPVCGKEIPLNVSHSHKTKDTRMGRTELYMEIAELIAQRGTCLRAKVGALAVKDGRVISVGYVGAVAGEQHCLEVGCLIGPDGGCQRTVHAEANVVTWAARVGTPLESADVYSTHAPCVRCAMLLINAGVSSLTYRLAYRQDGLDLLKESMKVTQYESTVEAALD